MEDALSSKDLKKNTMKGSVVESFWPDVAFGNLMRDWLRILTSARREVEQLRSAFSTTLAESLDRNIACGNLELFCNGVYEKVLKSGFRHREEISRYSRWEEVIHAMPSSRRW